MNSTFNKVFGLKKEIPSHKVLNYIGVLLVLLSTIFYLLVKNNEKPKSEDDLSEPDEKSNLIDSTYESTNSSRINAQTVSIYERLSPVNKRLVGIGLCVFSGLLYGQAFTPIVYIRDNYKDASNNNMDYLFSFYTGILVTSLAYFVIYSIILKNKPVINNQLVLPGLASGKRILCGLIVNSRILIVS